MVFKNKAYLLEFQQTAPTKFEWKPISSIWCEVVQTSKKGAFDDTQSTIFKIYRKNIGFSQALMLGGNFFHIDKVVEKGVYVEISTTQVTLKDCRKIEETITYNEMKNPITSINTTLSFPAIRYKKSRAYEQDDIKAQLSEKDVLLTPKDIELAEGDLIEISGKKFMVIAVDDIAEFKNEYEIKREDDA